MDYALRCNSLKCRAQLTERAVVTTCSHIFCVPCSKTLGLANPNGNARSCPACETHLTNPDDAVLTQLNPTEDYKTSVLSGLNPSVIMECAGRGLSFYSYQTSQEIIYQEFLARSLTDKYSTLSSQMDKIIHDANSEITSLRDKLSNMHLEQKDLEKKNHDLAEKFREKARNSQQLQQLYNSLKRQQQAAGIELAADHDAEDALQAISSAQFGQHGRRQHNQSRNSNGSGSTGSRQNIPNWEAQMQGSRAELQTARSAPVSPTPSHRQPLASYYGNRGTNGMSANDHVRRGTPLRQPFASIDPNVYGGGSGNNAGYMGMSAGIKVGRQHDGSMGRNSQRGHGGRGDGRNGPLNGLGIR